uniref:Uncharacterized protein n=1 Tax=Solanum tuberosum TaxID=4113 RepID=M1ALB1_SOLTU
MSNTAANNINYDTFTLSSSLPSFNAFQESQDPDSRTISRNGPNSGWNMVLFEATPQTKASPTTSNNVSNFSSFYLNELYNQNSLTLFSNSVLKLISNMNNYNQIPVLKPTNYYNPFLPDTSKEQPATPNMGTNTAASMFSSTLLPISQAAITTFSGQNSTSAVQSDLN